MSPVVVYIWRRSRTDGTRGSVIVVALFHGAFNVTTGQKFIPEFVPGDPIWVYAVYAALALIVIALTRGRLGYGGDPAARPVDGSRPVLAVPDSDSITR